MPLGPAHTCLAVLAHPDDEAYALGGTLARLAASGVAVHVRTVTAGEQGATPWIAEPAGSALAVRRRHELAASGAALGATSTEAWAFEDGRVAECIDAAEARILGELERLEPDLILGMGFDGAYGHVDHLATRTALRRAWRARVVGRLYEVVFAKGVFAPVRRALLRHAPAVVGYRGALGVERAQVDVHVNIAPWATPRRQALAAHTSQLRDGDPDRFLGRGLLGRLGTEEWFVEVAP